MIKSALLVVVSIVSMGGSVWARDRIEMQGTSITGNRELPSVLYILPWKSAHQVELGELPFTSLLNAMPQPIEPGEYRRKVQLFHELNRKPADGGQ